MGLKVFLLVVFTIFMVLEMIFLCLPVAEETYWGGESPADTKLQASYVYNNFGFRDIKNYSVKKPSGMTRIVSVGDSFTSAEGIQNYKNSFNKRVEMVTGFEVISFAKGGDGFGVELEYLNDVLVLDPDLIILNYFMNDIGDIFLKRVSRLVALTRHSTFYYFVNTRLDKLLEKVGVFPTIQQQYLKAYNDEGRLEKHRVELEKFIRLTKEKGVRLLIVIHPALFESFENYELRKVHLFVKETAEKENIEVLDLLPAVEGYDVRLLRNNNYDFHPNEFYHIIAAS